jgi:putative addiction module killer protein
MPKVEEYLAADGRNHYREWFNRLAAQAASKAATAVARMAAGNTSNLKGIGHGLAEWKIDWGPGIRIYVHQDGAQLIVLIGGSDKDDQTAEIKAATSLVEEYKQRKKAMVQADKAKAKKASPSKKKDKK